MKKFRWRAVYSWVLFLVAAALIAASATDDLRAAIAGFIFLTVPIGLWAVWMMQKKRGR